MHDASSPTARALLALELIQGSPGTTAERLGERLGVSERAARRYVAILREAGVPIESVRGPVRRLPGRPRPAAAAADVHRDRGARPGDGGLEARGGPTARTRSGARSARSSGSCPRGIAQPLEALREVTARRTDPDPPHPETTATLVRASSERRRVRIGYALGPHRERTLQVDPWAVVVRHGRWYVLGWSHAADARRMYRIDRVTSVEVLAEPFTPPEDLDPLRALEEQMSQGWPHPVEVEIDAPLEEVRRWLPRSLGRTEAIDDERTRLTGSTENLNWYATEIAEIQATFKVVGGPEIRDAVRRLTARLEAPRCPRRGPGRPAPAR